MPVFNAQGLPVQLVIQPDRNFADLAAQIRPGQVLKGRVMEVLKGGRAIVNFRGIPVTAALQGVVLAKGEAISVVVKDAEGLPVLRLVDAGEAAQEAQRPALVLPGIDPDIAAILERLGLPRDEFHAAVVSLVRDYGGNPSRETVMAVKELVFSLPALLDVEAGWAAGDSGAGAGIAMTGWERRNAFPAPAAVFPSVHAGTETAGVGPGSLPSMTPAEAGESVSGAGTGTADPAAAAILSRGYILGRIVAASGGAAESRLAPAPAGAEIIPAPAGSPGEISGPPMPAKGVSPGLADLLFAGTARLESASPADLLFRIADWVVPVPGRESLSSDAARLALTLGREYPALQGGSRSAARTADLLGESARITVSAAEPQGSASTPAGNMTIEAAGFIAGILHETAARVFEGRVGLPRSPVIPAAPFGADAAVSTAAGYAAEAIPGGPVVDVVRLMGLVSEAARAYSPGAAVPVSVPRAVEGTAGSLAAMLLSGKVIELGVPERAARPEDTPGSGGRSEPGGERAASADGWPRVAAGGSLPAASARDTESGPGTPAVARDLSQPAGAAEPVLPRAVLDAEGISPRILETAVFMHLTGLPAVGDAARAANEYLFGETRVPEVLRRFEEAAGDQVSLPPRIRNAVDRALTAARSMEVSLERGRIPEVLRAVVERIGLDHESVLARAATELRGASLAGETAGKLKGARETLKSAFLDLREVLESYRAAPAAADASRAGRLSRLDAAAGQVIDLVQSQQVGSFVRPDASQTIYAQVPILFGNELRGGELHLSWRRDGNGKRRDRRAPAVVSVFVGTRSLGPVKAQVRLTGSVLSVNFQAATREAAAFLNAEMPELLSRLEGLRYRVQGMSCGVEEGAGEPGAAAGALRPTSALDLKA